MPSRATHRYMSAATVNRRVVGSSPVTGLTSMGKHCPACVHASARRPLEARMARFRAGLWACGAHVTPCAKRFERYGRVDPEDEWLLAFQCYDGLIIEKANEQMMPA